jgi:hypothetical protein
VKTKSLLFTLLGLIIGLLITSTYFMRRESSRVHRVLSAIPANGARGNTEIAPWPIRTTRMIFGRSSSVTAAVASTMPSRARMRL